MFPIEIGNWADPVTLRKQFGKELLMMGGFDKRILAQSPQAIDDEIARLTPLVEEGGFIPFCDHRVPPDVPLVNYEFYCKRAGQVWGKRLK
jgi:uroporphyrinogen decarboxylase